MTENVIGNVAGTNRVAIDFDGIEIIERASTTSFRVRAEHCR